jgi:hypothetical protein
VIFSIIAVSVHLIPYKMGFEGGQFIFQKITGSGQFDFIHNTTAMIILSSYIVAYAIRIYIMNYFKNTRPKGVKQDNKGYYAIEQFSAAFVMIIVATLVFFLPELFGLNKFFIQGSTNILFFYRKAFIDPLSVWPTAILAGTAFGAVSFFSVFIFMYKGRTATFAGLVNRLTSLVAGTFSTLMFCATCRGAFPKIMDWLSLLFILIAVGFITKAEKKRVAELLAAQGKLE